MATDHRGNPINENNLPKTTKDRMGELLYTLPPEDEMTPEQEEIAERESQIYMKELEEYYRPVLDRTYGKNEMIENDIDDDKY